MAEETTEGKRLALSDLAPKRKLEGRVTSVELFGAFVDIGAEREGLVHISQISEKRVNRVADALHKGDEVTVWVRGVDAETGRIDLTMIEPPERTIDDLQPDQIVTGTVTKLAPYGAFVDIGVGRDGLIHISEMSKGHTNTPSEVVNVGDEVQVRVVQVNRRRRRIELSLLGIPGEGDEIEPGAGGEEEPMTAMASALQEAMARHGMSLKVPTQRKGRRKPRSEIRRQQAAIIARTLRSKAE